MQRQYLEQYTFDQTGGGEKLRQAIKKSAEWIHASLIIAIIMPLVYSLGAEQPDIIGRTLYFKCLIIVLPVVATDFAVNKCKGLLSYLITCILIFASTAALGWSIAGSLHQSQMLGGYMVILMVETMFVITNRMAERMHRRRAKDITAVPDPTWRPSFDSLREPSFAVLIYFLAVYALAVNLNNSAVCNAALFSAVLYTVITVLYQYICETENYLFLNKRTCNIPSRRIYGIGNGMLAIFMLLFIIVLLPALFTISNRHYRDLRKSTALIEFDFEEIAREYDIEHAAEDPMQALIEQYGEPKPTPEWLITLSYIMEVAVLLILVAALVKVIYNTFRAFREAADENGDIVEELEETDEAVKIKKPRVSRRRLSERERIRKEYRKFIRRYRKDRPAHYETPTEIEMNAGIAENEECQEIHRHYELARYGQE